MVLVSQWTIIASLEDDMISGLAFENEGHLVLTERTAFILQTLAIFLNPGQHGFIGVILATVNVDEVHAAATGTALVENGRVFDTRERKVAIEFTKAQVMGEFHIHATDVLLVDTDDDAAAFLNMFDHALLDTFKFSHAVNEPVLTDLGFLVGHAVLAALEPHDMVGFMGFEFLGRNPGLDFLEIISD